MPTDTSAQGLFVLASLKVEEGLRRANALLKSKALSSPDPAETNSIYARIAELDSKIAAVHAERLAVLAEMTTIVGPSNAQYEQIEELASKIDALTASANDANRILAAATAIAQAWNSAHAPA